MRSFYIIILLAAITFSLSSCSDKNSKTTNLLIIPSEDSVTKGSWVQIFFGSVADTLTDLTVQNSPVEMLFASNDFNINDSIWRAKILVTDYHLARIGLNLSVVDTTNGPTTNTGTYIVNDIGSTLTDYSTGENKTYTVLRGSTVTITHGISPFIGTFVLNLYYNHTNTTATGSFKIFK